MSRFPGAGAGICALPFLNDGVRIGYNTAACGQAPEKKRKYAMRQIEETGLYGVV
jgi:hypothetical protein